MFHSRPEKEYRALNPACPVHSCDTVKRSTYDKSTNGDVGSVHEEEEIILEKEKRVAGEEEEELEREIGRDDDECLHDNECDNRSTRKGEDSNKHNVNDNSNTTTKIKDNIVILPYPFNVLGGVPYYLEDEARYSHKPFVSGCAKEVRKNLGSCIPMQILLILYLYLSFFLSIFLFILHFFFCFIHIEVRAHIK